MSSKCSPGCRCSDCEEKIFTSKVIYDGSYLSTLNIVPQDDMNIVLGKINSFLSNALPHIDIQGGSGISVSKVSDTYTISNTSPNVVQTITLAGNNLILSNGGGTVALPSGLAQQNADWNATSGVAQILNKPTIPANQTLSWDDSNRKLSISSGNNVTIPGGTYTAGAGISIVGNTISNSSPNTNQTLGISGYTLSLTNGGSVTLPSPDGSETKVTVDTGLSISGTGKSSDPYVIGNTSPNVQPDWSQTNSSAPDFIKNKPLDPDGFKTYYVDGNNQASGDGSSLNPFQTLDQAYNKVIGNGTAANPDNKNITIKVFSHQYSTNINLFAETLSWEFDTGTYVEYTGSDYLFNTSAIVFTHFEVSGKWNFNTTSGGLIQVNSLTADHRVDFEINNATQNLPNITDPFSFSMIKVVTGYSLGDWNFARLNITLHGVIKSVHNTTIQVDGYSNLYIKGQSSFSSLISGGSTPNDNIDTQRVLYYNNNDPLTSANNMYSQEIVIKDVTIASDGVSAVTIGGLYGKILLDNIYFTATQAVVNNQASSIEVDDLVAAKYSTNPDRTNACLIRNCIFKNDIYSGTDPIYAITYIGSNDGTDIEMSGNIIPKPYLIHSKLNLNSKIGVMSNTATNLNTQPLPTYADNTAALSGGLVKGDQYITSTGQLMVVI